MVLIALNLNGKEGDREIGFETERIRALKRPSHGYIYIYTYMKDMTLSLFVQL